MSRGDQRERDRAKSQAKLDAKKKSEGQVRKYYECHSKQCLLSSVLDLILHTFQQVLQTLLH